VTPAPARCSRCGGRFALGAHPDCGTATRLDRIAALPLPRVPGYTALAHLGGGGFGVVVRARRERDGAEVAIKLARDGAEARARLAREREVLALLGPPHVPALLDHGALADGTPFLAMELISLPTLADRMAHAPGPVGGVAELVAPIATALAHVHARGVVHRDLKPENAFAGERAVLVDFGLARAITSVESTTRTRAGTAYYMAPEQITGGDATGATDVYALGVMLYELATGVPPFAGSDAELRVAHVGHRPRHPGDRAAVPRGLASLIVECLAKDPARRPAPAEIAARLVARDAVVAAASGPSAREKLPCAVLWFEGAATATALAATLASRRGVLLGIDDGVWAAVFSPVDGPRAVARARRAGDELIAKPLEIGTDLV
jgi:eukaryotic-like serine/threonine-protein kinase